MNLAGSPDCDSRARLPFLPISPACTPGFFLGLKPTRLVQVGPHKGACWVVSGTLRLHSTSSVPAPVTPAEATESPPSQRVSSGYQQSGAKVACSPGSLSRAGCSGPQHTTGEQTTLPGAEDVHLPPMPLHACPACIHTHKHRHCTASLPVHLCLCSHSAQKCWVTRGTVLEEF